LAAAAKETAVVVLGAAAMGATAWAEVAMVRAAAKEAAVAVAAAVAATVGRW
jgi:hypothetical protein